MYLKLRPNVAINTRADQNASLVAFYASIGVPLREAAPQFTIIGSPPGGPPPPFGCYLVSWSPLPHGESQVCLQFETDAIDELHNRLKQSNATIEFFGPDDHAPSKRTLWFRDPAGNLMNVVEA